VDRHPTTGGLSRSVGTSRRAGALSRMVSRGWNANWSGGPVRPTVSQEIPRIFAPQLLRGARLPILSRAPAPAANSTVALAAGTPTTVTQRIPRRNPVLDPIPYERNLVKQHGTLGWLPKDRALGRGRIAAGTWRTVATKLATTSYKKHPETDEPRANKVNYVIEIQGTA